ncbi:MAG TPA: hypothetical protein VF179_01565, partial [Thermoanaerobaculia bacterium]|nr:hypothetical protein [Thermoanaerobaculia bacterium]
VMVRWSSAMIALALPREQGAIEPGMSPVSRWGLVYLLVWVALIVAFLWFLDAEGSEGHLRNLVLMLRVAAGWLALNYLLIVFIRAIQRANLRQKVPVEEPAEGLPQPEPAPVEQPAAPPAPRSKLRDVLLMVRNLILTLIVIAIGEALPPMQRLHAWVAAHDGPILAVTITAGVIGFALFMGGVIHMVLRAQAQESVTLAEVKAAWRIRAWQVSPRWRRIFLIQIGVALFAIGLFGSLFVLAFQGLKLLLGGVIVYAVVRTVVAFIKA